LWCIGKYEKRAVAINDKIEIKPMCTVWMTVDHRYGDAAHLKNWDPIVRSFFEDPENFNT